MKTTPQSPPIKKIPNSLPKTPLWQLIRTISPDVHATERRMIWQTSLPLVLSFVIHASMNLVDTLMVARLGSVSLSAVSLGGMVFFTVVLLLRPMLSTTASLGSQALGAGNEQRMRDIFRNGLWLATMGGLVCVALGFGLSYGIMPHTGQDPAVITEMQNYLDGRMWEMFWQFYLQSVFISYMTTRQKNTIMIHLGVFSVVVNVVLNYALIFGNGGFPALGVYGAGLATTISQGIATVLCFVYLWVSPVFRNDFRRLLARVYRIDSHIMRDIITSGGRVTLSTISDHLAFASSSLYAGMLGVAVLATYQIVSAVWQLAFIGALAMGQALVSRVGYHAGRGDTQRAFAVIVQGVKFSLILAGVSMVAIFACQHALVGWVLPYNDPYFTQVNTLFIGVAWLLALSFLFDNVVGVLIGASRGFNDGKMLVWGHLAINTTGVIMGYVFALVLGWGLLGVLVAVSLPIVALCIAHTARLAYLYRTGNLYYGVKLGD